MIISVAGYSSASIRFVIKRWTSLCPARCGSSIVYSMIRTRMPLVPRLRNHYWIDLRQERSIRKVLYRSKTIPFWIRTSNLCFFMQQFPVCKAEEASVFNQQCVLRDVFPKLLDKLPFGILPSAECKCNFYMSPQFDTDLLCEFRESAFTTTS